MSLYRLFMIGTLALGAAACTTHKMVEPDRNVSALHVSHDDVRDAITSTLKDRKWTVLKVGPDSVEADITVRQQFYAHINIPYSANHYEIDYLDSHDLSAEDGRIKKAYIGWVKHLNRDIYMKLRSGD